MIDKPGKVEVHAVSEPAVLSDVLQFDATSEGVAVTVIAPLVITATPEPPTPTPTVVPENNFISPEGYPRAGVWFLVLLGVFGSAILVFWAVSRIITPRWGLRFALAVLIGGFGAYNYLALGFPRALDVDLFRFGGRSVFCCLRLPGRRWGSSSPGSGGGLLADQSRKQAEQEQYCRAPCQRGFRGLAR
ncbi:MAG: hypothetical protein MZV64_17830 [Ignavibacteriales bacterium]|nr:hypothetical protein [Ignavibacteriales bacterium]